MADLLPILSKEEEDLEDSPDTARFRELPPPYSENESVDAHTSKQVLCQSLSVIHLWMEYSSEMFQLGDCKCG